MRSVFLSLVLLVVFCGTSLAGVLDGYDNKPNVPKSAGYIIDGGKITKAGESLTGHAVYMPINCNVDIFKKFNECQPAKCELIINSSKGDKWATFTDTILDKDKHGRCHILSESWTADHSDKVHKLECYLRDVSREAVMKVYISGEFPGESVGGVINAAKMYGVSGVKKELVSDLAGRALQEDCNPRKWKKYDPDKPPAQGPDMANLQARMLALQKAHPEFKNYGNATPEEKMQMDKAVIASVLQTPSKDAGSDKPDNSVAKPCEGFAMALSACKKFSCTSGESQFGVGGFQDNGACYVTAFDDGKLHACDVPQSALQILSSAAAQPSGFIASLHKLGTCK